MPRIPMHTAAALLPPVGGLPRGAVDIPTVQDPQANPAAFTATEQGLQTLGEGLGSAGVGLVRAQELEAVRRRADNTLSAKTKVQDFRLAAQETFEQEREGDYSTFPQRLTESLQRRMHEVGRDLSPDARALFEEDAKQYLPVYRAKADEYSTRRRAQLTTFTVTREIQQVQEFMARATDPAERALHQDHLEGLLEAFASTGLIDGAKAADVLTKTQDALRIQDVQTAIQANPDAMAVQLLAQARGEPTRDDLPTAPPAQLPQLAQQAQEVKRQRAAEVDRAEQRGDKALTKQQEAAEVRLRQQITELDPVPENLAQYDALLRTVNQQAIAGQIRPERQAELTNLTRVLRTAAAAPREANDPKAERDLTLLVYAADNPKDFADVHTAIVKRAHLLKPETYRTLLSQAEERSRTTHWSNLPGVRAGRQIILGGDINEGGQSQFRGAMAEAEQVRLREALDVYTTRIQELSGQSVHLANAQAPAIALEVRRTYMDLPQKEELLKRLPVPLQGQDGQGVRDLATAQGVIQRLPHMTDAEKQRVFEQWMRWNYIAPGSAPIVPTAPRGGQAGSGRERVKGP